MNTRSIGILAVLTAATVALGVLSSKKREQASAAAAQDQLLFPELGERINDVASVQVASGEGSFTIAHVDNTWGLTEKAAYPVDEGKVRKLLFALKDAVIVEPKTSKPDLYPMLGVEGAEVDDAPSVEVTLKDPSGASLAALIVGNRGENRSKANYYVRRVGEAPSLLVAADLEVDKGDSAWLNKEIVDITRARVKAIEIRHASGERVLAHKPDAAATDFELADIPEGKELRYAGAPGSLATGMARLNMEDVRAAADVTLPAEPLAVTTFWTYDGLRVAATLYEVDDELLATFDAAFDEEGPALDTFDGQGLLVEDGMALPDSAEGTEDGASAPADKGGPTPAQVQSEAQTLSTKTGPWVYVLPSWKKSNLAKTMEELTKDIPAPVEPAPVEEDAPGAFEMDAAEGMEGDGTEMPAPVEDHSGHDHAGHGHGDEEHGDEEHGDEDGR